MQWFNLVCLPFCHLLSVSNKPNQAKRVSCVSLRAVQCWGDVSCPLRVSWRGCSVPFYRCWTTNMARQQQLRWTQLLSAWGASRSTCEPCLLSSSRGRAGANSHCLVFGRGEASMQVERDDSVKCFLRKREKLCAKCAGLRRINAI